MASCAEEVCIGSISALTVPFMSLRVVHVACFANEATWKRTWMEMFFILDCDWVLLSTLCLYVILLLNKLYIFYFVLGICAGGQSDDLTLEGSGHCRWSALGPLSPSWLSTLFLSLIFIITVFYMVVYKLCILTYKIHSVLSSWSVRCNEGHRDLA